MYNILSNNKIIRKLVAAFGAIFSSIVIEKIDSSTGEPYSLTVPIRFVHLDKMMFMVERGEEGEDQEYISWYRNSPRIGYDISSIKVNSELLSYPLNQIYTQTSEEVTKFYNPIPIIIDFNLVIISNKINDNLDIIEAVLPYFASIKSFKFKPFADIDYTKDFSIAFNGVNIDDRFEGAQTERREVVSTLSFSMTAELYQKPIESNSSIIKTVRINFRRFDGIGEEGSCSTNNVMTEYLEEIIEVTTDSDGNQIVRVLPRETDSNDV